MSGNDGRYSSPNGKLNTRQKLFIDEYLVDLNATNAYIRAGYSPNGASVSASHLLANPKIRANVDKAMAERSKRTGITQERVVLELARVALASPPDFINMDTATLKPDASRDDCATIQSVRVKTTVTPAGEGVEREIKVADKIKALELLGKHLGMFTDKLSISDDRPTIVDNIPSPGAANQVEHDPHPKCE